jgi:hypothetical protein
MTTRKKSGGGKQKTRKLKLRRETLRDLDARSKARNVKGGRDPSAGCPSFNLACTYTCVTQCGTCLNCYSRTSPGCQIPCLL